MKLIGKIVGILDRSKRNYSKIRFTLIHQLRISYRIFIFFYTLTARSRNFYTRQFNIIENTRNILWENFSFT